MTVEERLYAVGIDLGTTNSAVSFAALNRPAGEKPVIRQFPVPQLTGSGEFSTHPVLPSFLYLPGEYEISEAAISHPWRMPDKRFAGIFARDFGAGIPARLVSSAKSWLCEKEVDRKAPILPWGTPDEVGRVSPVQASAAFLNHIKKAWNFSQGEEEEAYLEHQLVVVTVPASFDEVARDLTMEAATLAGLRNIILLEEPLAAFYSWLFRHETDWSAQVSSDELILVCDVGGGTTDLTLITLSDESGSPRFERVAVGDHLILGGDNIDLTLARQAEQQLGRSLDSDRLKTLCHRCRQAKERLLNDQSRSERITLMGEGSSLIAGTLSTTLSAETVKKIVLEQFFPLSPPPMDRGRQPGKVRSEFGLSYEGQSAVTAHMLEFLDRHGDNLGKKHSGSPVPDLILFNGGALQPEIVKNRIRECLRREYAIEDPQLPRIMDNPVHDTAVSIGAAYYGLVKAGQGVRVGSGSPRSYYLEIDKDGEAPAGQIADAGRPVALCVVERGMEEGSQIALAEKSFEVAANRQVGFNLYSSSFRSGDRTGDLIEIDDTVTPLPPVRTVIGFGEKGRHRNIPVQIEAEYTELGTLVLWCRSLVSPHRWQLQFQLREMAAGLDMPDADETLESTSIEAALDRVREVLSDPATDHAAVKRLSGLVSDLARLVGLPREKWPLAFLRALADTLISLKHLREISPRHEARWLNLTGFAARPGMGDGLDGQRVKALWRIYNQGPCFPGQAQGKTELWIMVRRIACGLKPGQQRQFLQEVSPLIMPAGGRVKIQAQEAVEIWMAVANMERLLVKEKVSCGRWLVSLLTGGRGRAQHLWALSRLGAREMLYGSADRVIPPGEVSTWVEAVLVLERLHPGHVAAAVAQMIRRTGDRTRDVDEALAGRVLQWLEGVGMRGRFKEMITRVVPVARQEASVRYGEALPAGLILKS